MNKNENNIRSKEVLKQSHENHICPYTKKEAKNVYTDHQKICVDENKKEFIISFNSCEHCGENKTMNQRLNELLIKRMKGEIND